MVKLNEVLFSDIYITPDKIAYIPDNVTPNGLEVLEAEDFDDFFDLIEQSWDGNNPSYSVMFDEIFYRVERTVSIYGIQYCARKCQNKCRRSTVWDIRLNFHNTCFPSAMLRG